MMEFTNAPPPASRGDGFSGLRSSGSGASESLRSSGNLRSSREGEMTSAMQARVSDEWLELIADVHPEVLYLDLTKAYRLTDGGISSFLPKMNQLRSLMLTKCKRLTDKSFRGILRNLTNLNDLSLGATSATCNTVLDEICPYLNLSSLDLSSLQLNDDSLLQITRTQTRMQSLCIKACTGLSDQSLVGLSQLTNLHSLDVTFTGISVSGFKTLEKLTRLHHLSAASNAQLDNTIAPSLKCLVNLTSLDLSSTECGETVCEALATLTNLAHLWMDRTWINSAGVVSLHSLPLETLHLTWNTLSDECVQSIALMTTLRSLKLSYCGYVSNVGVSAISTLTQLTFLEVGIASCALTRVCLPSLAALTDLRSLALCETKINEEELELLSTLTRLAPRDLRMSSSNPTHPSYIFRSYGPFSSV